VLARRLPAFDFLLPASVLLDGFRLFMQFLLEQETNYLCGATFCMHTPTRTNYRMGCYARRFSTCIGEFPLLVPHLMYFYPRVSIVKRAKRLSLDILCALDRIHTAGATTGEASALIKSVWTLELSDEILAGFAAKFVPLLETWRNGGDLGFQPIHLTSRRRAGKQEKPAGEPPVLSQNPA